MDDAPPTGRAAHLARVCAVQVAARGLDPDAALVIGTSKGPVENWLASPSEQEGGIDVTGLADIASRVGDCLGLRGPRLTISAACASGLQALIEGVMLIRSRQVTQALVVASESSLHPLFIGCFQRLGVLARPGRGCRPFDRQRDGFLMSEAAAAVLLEVVEPSRRHLDDEEDRGAHGSSIIVDGFALGADATHLTGGDPQGRVLRTLLGRLIDDRPVDLIHAHGTGTRANDPAELAAIESCLTGQADRPVLYSHKGALGHSFGAAGLISTVINCQSHRYGLIPPNIRTTDPMATERVLLSRQIVRRPIHRSVALAAGFGGAMAMVALRSRSRNDVDGSRFERNGARKEGNEPLREGSGPRSRGNESFFDGNG